MTRFQLTFTIEKTYNNHDPRIIMKCTQSVQALNSAVDFILEMEITQCKQKAFNHAGKQYRSQSLVSVGAAILFV